MSALRFRTTNFLLALVLLALGTLIAMQAADVRGGPLDPPAAPASTDSVRLPGTPISSQMTISSPGHYYLTRDINVTGAQAAITISASNVSVDLGGFTLDGDDAAGSYGVRVVGAVSDIVVSNGTVRDFQFGLIAEDASRVKIDRVHAASNVRGFHLGDSQVLSNCTAINNTETGIYLPGDSSTVKDCESIDNGSDGIAVAGGLNVVIRNQSRRNGNEDLRDAGTPFTGTVMRENVVRNIILKVDGYAYVIDNTCVGAIADPGGNFLSGNTFC